MTDQRRSTTITLIALIAMAIMGALIFLSPPAHGAPQGDALPKAAYGKTAVLNSAATKVFNCLAGRNAYKLANLGPNTIFCGFDSSVTTATGFPVPTASATLNGYLEVELVCQQGPTTAGADGGTSSNDVYCIAGTADQSGTATTRWLQVK